MTETNTTRFITVPRTAEHGGYENKCYTHYVQDNGGRYCLHRPMVQTDAEWLANKMNTQGSSPTGGTTVGLTTSVRGFRRY